MTTGRRPTFDPDELDDTADESPRRGTNPGRSPFAPPPTHPPIHVTPTDIADSEWGRRLETLIESGRTERDELRNRVEQVEQRNRILWRVIGVVSGVSGTAALLAVKLVYSAGDSAGEARGRNAQIAADHARLEELDRVVTRNSALINLLLPNGVLRVYGPPRDPNDPKDPPP